MTDIPQMRSAFGSMILSMLKDTNTRWVIRRSTFDSGNKRYITDVAGRCPVCSVVHQMNPSIYYYSTPYLSAYILTARNLTDDEFSDIHDIAIAADNEYPKHDNQQAIRHYLLSTLNPTDL